MRFEVRGEARRIPDRARARSEDLAEQAGHVKTVLWKISAPCRPAGVLPRDLRGHRLGGRAGWKRNPFLSLSAERAVYAVWFLLTVASGILVYALMTGDFRFAYVAQHSNRAMPLLTSSRPGGADRKARCCSGAGSSRPTRRSWFSQNRRKLRDMMPYVVAILMATQTFFLILNTFVASPFQMLAQDGAITAVPDGNGLNPLLQYLDDGDPSADAVSGLRRLHGAVRVRDGLADHAAAGRSVDPHHAPLDARHLAVPEHRHAARRRLGLSRCSAGAATGAGIRWRTPRSCPGSPATAFLHSVMMQEKKGMMKVWNMVLVSSTFFLCIFGTFLTRIGHGAARCMPSRSRRSASTSWRSWRSASRRRST